MTFPIISLKGLNPKHFDLMILGFNYINQDHAQWIIPTGGLSMVYDQDGYLFVCTLTPFLNY